MRDRAPGGPTVRLRGEDDTPRAWITYRRKNGTGAHKGTIALNPEYVRVHHEWLWLEVQLPPDAASCPSQEKK